MSPDEMSADKALPFAVGAGEVISLTVSEDATEDEIRDALKGHPCAIESTLQTFRELKAKHNSP